MQALLWTKGRDLKLHLFKTMMYTTLNTENVLAGKLLFAQ